MHLRRVFQVALQVTYLKNYVQVPRTFNSTVALQLGFSKHLGDVATVLLDLVCLSLFCFFMSFQTDWWSDQIRSDLCVEHWLLCKQKSHWIITINGKINVWKCKLIFPTDTLQQKIEISDLIILATTVNGEISNESWKISVPLLSHYAHPIRQTEAQTCFLVIQGCSTVMIFFTIFDELGVFVLINVYAWIKAQIKSVHNIKWACLFRRLGLIRLL